MSVCGHVLFGRYLCHLFFSGLFCNGEEYARSEMRSDRSTKRWKNGISDQSVHSLYLH